MSMNIVNRDIEILDPNMPIIQRIGRMARLCYKVETTPNLETDCRIIKKCIESGHESILEHGIISVFVNTEVTEDSKLLAQFTKSKTGFGMRMLWDYLKTDAENKYLETAHDHELYDKWKIVHNIENDEKKILPVICGDVRAWRQVMRERIYHCNQTGDKLSFILTLKVLNELSKVDGCEILFGDIVNDINDLLRNEDYRKHILLECDPAIDEKGNKIWTVKSVSDCFFKEINTVIAGEAGSQFSLSVIITSDRALTHQLVRHRKNVAYSQESQRYVNYGKKGCCAVPMVIDPGRCPKGVEIDPFTGVIQKGQEVYDLWYKCVENCFNTYEKLIELGVPVESARGVLPNDAKTKIGVTWFRLAGYSNFNFWRLDSHAQFTIRHLAYTIMFNAFKTHHPFMSSVPHDIAMKWLNDMLKQNILKDKKEIETVIADREKLQKLVMEYMKRRAQEAKKNQQKKK